MNRVFPQDIATWKAGKHGLFCERYTDRRGHYFYTPKAGEAVSKRVATQVGRALSQLGISHIAAYSPQARGRSERSDAAPAVSISSRRVIPPPVIPLSLACRRLEAVMAPIRAPYSAAPFQRARFDRVLKRPALGTGAAVFALQSVVPFRLGVGVVDQGQRRVEAQPLALTRHDVAVLV